MSGRIIAISNRKGGVGKSTLCAHLAALLRHRGQAVHVLDTDPQHSLVHWASLGHGLLAGHVEASSGEPRSLFRRVRQLHGEVNILIDTPPGLTRPSLLAALMADLVLIPVCPSPLDLPPARSTVALLRELRHTRASGKPQLALVPSQLTQNRQSTALPEQLRQLGEAVLPSIGLRAIVAASVAEGLTVLEQPKGGVAAEEFNRLGDEVLALVAQPKPRTLAVVVDQLN